MCSIRNELVKYCFSGFHFNYKTYGGESNMTQSVCSMTDMSWGTSHLDGHVKGGFELDVSKSQCNLEKRSTFCCGCLLY